MDAAQILTSVAILFLIAVIWRDRPGSAGARTTWLVIAAAFALAGLLANLLG